MVFIYIWYFASIQLFVMENSILVCFCLYIYFRKCNLKSVESVILSVMKYVSEKQHPRKRFACQHALHSLHAVKSELLKDIYGLESLIKLLKICVTVFD